MPRAPQISARELIKALNRMGFAIHSQRGSHIKLRRQTSRGQQILTVPNHKTIRKGTLHNILRHANITLSELRDLL